MSVGFLPGLFRTSAPADAVAADWRLAGWSPRIVRVSVAARPEARHEALQAIGAALGVAPTFGVNLDALWDTLRDLAPSTVLMWVDGSRFADANPGAWAGIGLTLAERTQQQPPFAVVLCGSGRGKRQ